MTYGVQRLRNAKDGTPPALCHSGSRPSRLMGRKGKLGEAWGR